MYHAGLFTRQLTSCRVSWVATSKPGQEASLMRAAWDVLYLLFCFPLLWPCYVSQIVTWCYYAMVWHCLLMYTLWLPAYIFQNLIPAPCHDFQLVWRSGHQTTCLTFESMSNSFWFVQIGSTVLRQMWTLSPETETVNNKFSIYMPLALWQYLSNALQV